MTGQRHRTQIIIASIFFVSTYSAVSEATPRACPHENRTISQDVVDVPNGASGPPILIDLAPCEQATFMVTVYRSDAWAGSIGRFTPQDLAGTPYEAPTTLWAEGRGSGGPDEKTVVFSKSGRTFEGARLHQAVVKQDPNFGGNIKYRLEAVIVPRPGYNEAGTALEDAQKLTPPVTARGSIVANPDPGHFYKVFVPAGRQVPFTIVFDHRGWPAGNARAIVSADDGSVVLEVSRLILAESRSYPGMLPKSFKGRWFTFHLFNDTSFAVWNTRTEIRYAICLDEQPCNVDAAPIGRYDVRWKRGQHCRAPGESQKSCTPTGPLSEGSCTIDLELAASSANRAILTARNCFGFKTTSATLVRNTLTGAWTRDERASVLIDGKKQAVGSMPVTLNDGDTDISGSIIVNEKSNLCEANGPSCTVMTFHGVLDRSAIGTTDSATEVGTKSARLRGYARAPYGTGTYYFEYWNEPFGPPTPPKRILRKRTTRSTLMGRGPVFLFDAPVKSLLPNTKYNYQLCGRLSGTKTDTCSPTVKAFVTTTFTNPPTTPVLLDPVAALAVGDPKLIADGDNYYVTGSGCPLYQSSDLVRWESLELCDDTKPIETRPHGSGQYVPLWGTEITKIASTYVLTTTGMRDYGAVGSRYSRGAIWIGTANKIDGPYLFAADATAKDQDATLIDPSIFVDPRTGTPWLTWTRHVDRPADSGQNQIVAQALDKNDITRFADSSSAPVVLLSTDVQPQARELAFPNGDPPRSIVEGQGLLFHDDRYFLHYAAGTVEYQYDCWHGEPYTFNVASSPTFPTRFQKPDQPLLSGGRGWRLPGHGSIFRDGTNDFWLDTNGYDEADPVCKSSTPCCEQPDCSKLNSCSTAPDCQGSECCTARPCDARCWCSAFGRKLFLQKMLYDPIKHAFSIGDGLLQPGPIGVPVPGAPD